MPDPEMVSRAHRAAVTLERAWERWRIMHGLSVEPMPPVSSYVGYSIEEPWGRPRVVFGVDASEAEMLAALLDNHQCVGPFYRPVTDRSGSIGGAGLEASSGARQLAQRSRTAGAPAGGKARDRAAHAGDDDVIVQSVDEARPSAEGARPSAEEARPEPAGAASGQPEQAPGQRGQGADPGQAWGPVEQHADAPDPMVAGAGQVPRQAYPYGGDAAARTPPDRPSPSPTPIAARLERSRQWRRAGEAAAQAGAGAESPGWPAGESPDHASPPDARVQAQAPDQVLAQVPEQAPAQVPEQAPAQIPVPAPDQVAARAPEQAPARAPDDAPGQVPAQALDGTPDEADEAPAQTPDQAPAQAAEWRPAGPGAPGTWPRHARGGGNATETI